MNSSLFDSIFRSRMKWWLLLPVVLLFIAYQVDNVPRTDDEYLGEHVYWLLREGKVKSTLGYSELGYDIYQSIYHKLFIYTGYLVCRLTGWSLATLHITTYLCFAGFLWVLYRYTRQRYGPEQNVYFPALLILMLLNQDLLYAAGDFRPEVMIMSLGLAAFILLEKYLEQRKKSWLAASAVCAGLCMFAHLNGIIFIAAGCGLLLYRNMIKAAFLYGIIAALAFSPYFADVLVHADLSYFFRQCLKDPILAGQSAHWYTPLFKILNEQSRFLFTEQHIVFTATLLIVLIAAFKKLQAAQGNLLLYTAILILTLALVNPSKSTKYLVLYLPFLYIILTEGWQHLEAAPGRKLKIVVRSLLVAGIALSLFYSSRQIYRNIGNIRSGGIVAEGDALAARISAPHADIRLLAPRIMVFNEAGRFNILQDIGLVAAENLPAFLKTSGTDYVIFSTQDVTYFNLPALLKDQPLLMQLVDSTAHYKLVAVKRP